MVVVALMLCNSVNFFSEKTVSECAGLLQESCPGVEHLTFNVFYSFMVPAHWDEEQEASRVQLLQLGSEEDLPEESAEGAKLADTEEAALLEVGPSGKNLVASAPSESFAICQQPGFYRNALRPFYSTHTISNVVMGVIYGTSSYAQEAVALGRAGILPIKKANARSGSFFFMPNPKYHSSPAEAELTRKSRFVAWWIHADFVEQMQSWVSEIGDMTMPSSSATSTLTRYHGLGDPGDFGYSDVAKPSGYLHDYRDLDGEHLGLLSDLVEGIQVFLKRVLGDEALGKAHLSAGFHFPVRPEYSTLHLQVRVNSGVVPAADNRGQDLFQMLAKMQDDPEVFARDDTSLMYQASGNLRVALTKAAGSAKASICEAGPRSLRLG